MANRGRVDGMNCVEWIPSSKVYWRHMRGAFQSIGERERDLSIKKSDESMRPDRSDAHLPPEEQARIEQETRRYFEQIEPKRHPKPSRSDYTDDHSDDLQNSDEVSIPELDKLQNLKSNPQKVVCQGSEVVEEFVETEYYKDLNCIDKQHHTTGTGFIEVEKPSESCFDLNSVSGPTSVINRVPYRGNPATNEWIPSADPVIPASNKPSRSDL